jgi:hypothetical protein
METGLIYTGIMALLLFTNYIVNQNAYRIGLMCSGLFKYIATRLIFSKVLMFPIYKGENIGKMINLVTSDIEILDFSFY